MEKKAKMKSNDRIKLVNEYLKNETWRVNENSNFNYCLQGLNNFISSEVIKTYWLENLYDDEIAKAHVEGDIHIHDLNLLSAYCVGWDLADLLTLGFGGVSGKTESKPPKHFRAALGQVVNFLYTLQNETSGAQAFSSIDTYLAPFIKNDGLTYKEVKQAMQEFIFNLNVPTRTAAQTPFTNITLDLQVPESMKDEPVILGGERQESTYSEYQNEMDMFNQAFFEVMTEGDAKGRIFTFPIPTINITKDFDWENEKLKKLWEVTAKYGIAYFCNFVNSDLKPEDARSMCPLKKDTLVKVKLDGEVKDEKIENLIDKEFEVVFDNIWRKAHIVKAPQQKTITFECSNNDKVEMGEEHQQLVVREDEWKVVSAKDVVETDKFVYSENNSLNYYDLKSISISDKKSRSLYCVEVLEEGEKKDTYPIEDYHRLFELSSGLVTHNCRLRLDLTELKKKGGGLFGSAGKTGSIGVVTINLPRLAYKTKNEELFFEKLGKLIDISSRSLEKKREIIEKFTEEDLYPYVKYYLQSVKQRSNHYWDNHFSTIGFVGMNEACLNLFGEDTDILTKKGRDFGLKVMDFMREKLKEIQIKTGHMYNLEATPAEGASHRLAKTDKKYFPDIICANEKDYQGRNAAPYYTNSCQVPVDKKIDIFDLFRHQDEFQEKFTGGTVIHVFLGENLQDTNTVKEFVKTVCNNFKLPYFSLTPTFSVCNEHGYISGEHKTCPKCGKECEVYSRVVGYLRPVSMWNKGKKEEFKNRKVWKIN